MPSLAVVGALRGALTAYEVLWRCLPGGGRCCGGCGRHSLGGSQIARRTMPLPSQVKILWISNAAECRTAAVSGANTHSRQIMSSGPRMGIFFLVHRPWAKTRHCFHVS